MRLAVILVIFGYLLNIIVSLNTSVTNTSTSNTSINSNTTKEINETIVEVEVLPNDAPKLEYQLTAEQKYKLEHYADPNEFVEEFTQENVPREIQNEHNALKDFYHSTNGIFWLKNWDFTNGTLCGQYGVSCSDDGYITQLKLVGNNLTGTIPDVFRNLQNMVELDLSRNFLSGSTTFIADLPLLQVLRLNQNQLVGTIHEDIFRYIQPLKVFEIESNYIDGTIPSTFGLQRNLEVFRISNNKISGLLPQYLGRHVALRILMASHNKLRGGFPSSFDDLTELEVLILSHNQIQQAFPSAISQFKRLQILALDNNKLYGTLSDLQALRNLEVLWLQNNKLTGNITTHINETRNKKLQDLRLGGNYFDCDLYNHLALIHSDSPLDVALCDAKLYLDPVTKTNISIHSIP
eukprot:480360_1